MGTLDHSDDEMNIVLKDCSYTDGHGRQKKNVSAVHLRGSKIIFVVLPPMLSKAPMFSRVRYFKKHRHVPPLAVEQLEAEKRKQQNKSKSRGQGGKITLAKKKRKKKKKVVQ